MSKLLSLALIFLGEFLAVYSEALGARRLGAAGAKFLGIFGTVSLIMIIGGLFLIAGYMVGYKTFMNIWIVTAVSLTSILIIEPFLNYAMFHELPTRGALYGFVLGVVGIGLTLFVK